MHGAPLTCPFASCDKHTMKHVLGALIFVLLSSGCSSNRTTDPTSAEPAGSQEADATNAGSSESKSTGSAPASPSKRSLAPGATFADVVAKLRSTPDADADRPADCLLEGGANAEAVARVAAPASITPGQPPSKIAPFGTLASGTPSPSVGVLTPHGAAQERGEPSLWIATMTPVSASFARASPFVILWVTDETVWFGAIITHGTVGGDRWMRLEGSVLERFQSQIVRQANAIAVTADSTTSVTKLRTALSWLGDTRGEIALATIVEPPDERPQAPGDTLASVDRRNPPEGLCPLGISDVPAGMRPGDLGMAIFRVRNQFQSTLHDGCVSHLTADSAGGAVEVSMRVMADGSVSESCIQGDFIGIEALRACLREQARAFRFPRLGSGDFANVAMDVTFRPTSIPSRPLCDP